MRVELWNATNYRKGPLKKLAAVALRWAGVTQSIVRVQVVSSLSVRSASATFVVRESDALLVVRLAHVGATAKGVVARIVGGVVGRGRTGDRSEGLTNPLHWAAVLDECGLVGEPTVDGDDDVVLPRVSAAQRA